MVQSWIAWVTALAKVSLGAISISRRDLDELELTKLQHAWLISLRERSYNARQQRHKSGDFGPRGPRRRAMALVSGNRFEVIP